MKNFYSEKFDVIIIGGGHAGTEAAMAASRMGSKTLLLTHNIETIGQMSCNPAIGGIGKGHLVKEIDALGGVMGRAIDQAGIQFRKLNSSKGPAVQSSRAQADRVLYKNVIRKYVENQENLFVFQQAVEDLIIENNKVVAVKTQMGLVFSAKTVVLTAGTFLAGQIHIGRMQHRGGRAGEQASIGLSHALRELPFDVGRLKTGTPPRIDGRTIDYSVMEKQFGDNPVPLFSFDHEDLTAEQITSLIPKQVCCYVTYTNQSTHDIIRAGLDDSPMYNGQIEGVGPRYCPSIEDKIMRFADKDRHQIFVEPEGLTVHEIYPNGISTSLGFDTQLALVRSIKGFENAHITRPGYAIEYDYFNPQGLYSSLETKYIDNLFFAGQINGTTGYEEAAAQGLVAGINAARRAQDKELWLPKRQECYIGVLIDDLITKGTIEPYRMFTSRAEYRLLLREDNADLRLTQIGYELGLVTEERWAKFNNKQQGITTELNRLKNKWIQPNTPESGVLNKFLTNEISHEYSLSDLLRRPEVTYKLLQELNVLTNDTNDTDADNQARADNLTQTQIEQIEILIKYAGYIERQIKEIAKHKKHEELKLPKNFNYKEISGLSNEIKEKLMRLKPETIGQASRIAGITPAAISLLLVYITKHKFNLQEAV